MLNTSDCLLRYSFSITSSPGSHVFIWCTSVKEYHEELISKKYKYNRPGIEETFYGSLAFTVNDPFGNKISFNEKIDSEK